MRAKGQLITGIIGGLFAAAINVSSQYDQSIHDTNWKFDYKKAASWFLIGAALGISSLVVIELLVALMHSGDIEEDDFDAIDHLRKVSESYESGEFDMALEEKGLKVRKAIIRKFREDINGVKIHGSRRNKTHLAGISDYDLFVPLKRKSYAENFINTFQPFIDYFKNDYVDSDYKGCRVQGSSIGLFFVINDEEIRIDVVLGKKSNDDPNKNDYNIPVRKRGWFGKDTYTKMNLNQQSNLGVNAKAKAEVIKLLKIYKNEADLPIKPIIIRELTKAAFDENFWNLPVTPDEQLIMTLNYISKNIETKRIVAPDNTNNILSNLLSPSEKRQIAKKIDALLSEFEHNPAILKKHIPINSDVR